MESQIITILLIAGLNTPVYLELYKHALHSKASWIKISVTIVFWATAIITQTLAAFAGIGYLYFAYYRHVRKSQDSVELDIWNISRWESIKAALMTMAARCVILPIHFIYIIILMHLVKYNIKPQDIVEYYDEAQLMVKVLLAFEIILIAPIIEEYVFRYYLYHRIFAPRMPYALAALFSSALFTTVHFNVGGIPTFLGLGLFCTYLFHKKGYWAAVIGHATSNLITLLYILLIGK